MMDINFEALGKVIAPIVTTVAGLLYKKYFDERPKLVTYMIHTSAIRMNEPPHHNVYTHSIVVKNNGRKSAHNVRIGHNVLPSYQVFPHLAHEVKDGPDGSKEILLPNLVPNEQVTITYLYFPPLVWSSVNTYCKSDEMQAKFINISPSQQISRLQASIIWTLIFIGASTVVYWAMYVIWLALIN